MKVVYFAPDGFGYSSNQMAEGLHLLAQRGLIEFYCTNKMVHHGAKIEDLELVTDEEAYDQAVDADIILFASDGDMKFLDGIPGQAFRNQELQPRIVFLDGHDSGHLLADPEKMLMYLNREMRMPEACTMVYPNVRSFTFGLYQFLYDNATPADSYADRDIDISFVAFGGSNPARGTAANILKQLNGQTICGRKANVFVSVEDDCQPLSIDEYRSVMRRSKIGINVMGAGYDTLRFWEIMGHGAVLSSIDLNNVLHIRDIPEPHRHAIYFDSWNRMVELSRLVVCDSERWLRMRRATDKLIKCHSTTARAQQMIDMAQELA